MEIIKTKYYLVKDVDDFKSNLEKIIDETGGFVFIIIDGIKNSRNLREQTNIESICWILDNPTHYHNCEYLTIYTEVK